MGRKIKCVVSICLSTMDQAFLFSCLIGSYLKVVKTNRKQQLFVIVIFLKYY